MICQIETFDFDIRFYREYMKTEDGRLGQIEIESEEENEEKEEKSRLLCKFCGNRITSLEAMIAKDGGAKHVFSNPSGFVYEIGCFSFADGCVNHGPPTTEFTWFDGFGWRFALCSNCHAHLGWFYQSRDDSFYGLILDYLVEGQ